MKLRSRIVRRPALPHDRTAASSTPIYQTATFAQTEETAAAGFDYTRSGNPTRGILEAKLADLESGNAAYAYASGMAAVQAVLSLVPYGKRVVASADLYGGSFRLLDAATRQLGLDVEFCDTTDTDAVSRALARPTVLLLAESPSNPRHRITDIRALAKTCRASGTILAVDNSIMSPWLQRPLELGADLVIESATKFLCGHADLTAGVVACRDDVLAERLAFHHNATGAGLGPFDAWLLLRGVETLAIRVAAQQKTARAIARHLDAHPLVECVFYAGLKSHPGEDRHRQQADGPGSVLSFAVRDAATARSVIDHTQLFSTTVSFGSVRSTISQPSTMSHASIPERLRERHAPSDALVRLSVGLEDPDELIADLTQALSLRQDDTLSPVEGVA